MVGKEEAQESPECPLCGGRDLFPVIIAGAVPSSGVIMNPRPAKMIGMMRLSCRLCGTFVSPDFALQVSKFRAEEHGKKD